MKKWKRILAVISILVLLPYIVTVFINGKAVNADARSLLDTYCLNMLANEVSSDYEDEMLKVQAVIVRTTVYQNVDEIVAEEIESLDADPAWRRRLERAWKETEGQVLMYENELALLPFHYLSNGKTRSGEEVLESTSYPYLKVKECLADLECEEQLSVQMLELSGAEVVKKDSAGYVMELKVGELVQSGEKFREEYGLASSSFELQSFSEVTRVICKGIGHGLGLSQYSANEMAKEGKNYQEILQYFYEGTSLQEVAEILWDGE